MYEKKKFKLKSICTNPKKRSLRYIKIKMVHGQSMNNLTHIWTHHGLDLGKAHHFLTILYSMISKSDKKFQNSWGES
jgi:DNA polymerase II small subunit/DNA polymerase delta subunit B